MNLFIATLADRLSNMNTSACRCLPVPMSVHQMSIVDQATHVVVLQAALLAAVGAGVGKGEGNA